MSTMEKPLPVAGAGKIAEPGESSAQFFGRRGPVSNRWQPQDRWLLLMLLPPLKDAEEEFSPETLLGSDEVSLEKVSLTPGPAVIEITDEQAQQILDSHGEDAFPPQ